MNSSEVFSAVAWLLGIAFAGRVVLSFLPPGLPGRHAPAELLATWAASHILGSVAMGLARSIANIAQPGVSSTTLLLPFVVLAIVRWITLPGAMVPRREAFAEPPNALARFLFLAALAAVVAGTVVAELPATAAIDDCAYASALLVLCNFGLATARRAALGRAVCVLALASTLATAIAMREASSFHVAILMGAGAASMVAWLRRGDRRAAALASIAFAGTALDGPHAAVLGAAGLFVLWVHTPAPSKRAVAVVGAVAISICAVAGVLLATQQTEPPFPTRTSLAVALVGALALASRKRLVDARDRRLERPAVPSGPVDSARPQSDSIRDVVFLGLLLAVSRQELTTFPSIAAALLPLVPLVAVEFGLLLSPAERPLPGTRAASSGAEASAASPR